MIFILIPCFPRICFGSLSCWRIKITGCERAGITAKAVPLFFLFDTSKCLNVAKFVACSQYSLRQFAQLHFGHAKHETQFEKQRPTIQLEYTSPQTEVVSAYT
jgi:hypothetical protein